MCPTTTYKIKKKFCNFYDNYNLITTFWEPPKIRNSMKNTGAFAIFTRNFVTTENRKKSTFLASCAVLYDAWIITGNFHFDHFFSDMTVRRIVPKGRVLQKVLFLTWPYFIDYFRAEFKFSLVKNTKILYSCWNTSRMSEARVGIFEIVHILNH